MIQIDTMHRGVCDHCKRHRPGFGFRYLPHGQWQFLCAMHTFARLWDCLLASLAVKDELMAYRQAAQAGLED